MPPTSLCPNLLSKGGCLLDNCEYIHNVHPCSDCQKNFTEAEYASHLDSEEHKRNSSPFVGNYCRICRFRVPQWALVGHLTGKRHHDRVLKHQRTAPDLKAGPRPFFVDCKPCGYSMHHSKWPKHVSSPSHSEKAQFASLRSVIGESEHDKNGVSVSPDVVDFGLLDLDSIRNRPPPSISLKVTAPLGLLIENVRLSSSGERAATSAFSFSVSDARRRAPNLPYAFNKQGGDVAIAITLRLSEIGRFTDRIQFQFSKVSDPTHEKFVITRALRAAVGVKEDYDLLKPKAPYSPGKRREHLGEEKVIPGIRPPVLMHVEVHLRTILQWAVSKELSQVLRSGKKRSEILKVIKDGFLPPGDLRPETYKQRFGVLLHIEEEQSHIDVQRYDQDDALLEPMLPYFRLPVPGLAEKRPSLILGDRVLVRKKEYNNGPWYEGFVHKVLDKAVKLRFNDSFHGYKGQKYFVRFKVNRGPFKRMHQALAEDFGPDLLFFPSLAHIVGRIPPSGRALAELRPFNRSVLENNTQRLAVAAIMGQSAGSVPFLIFGPPGTGKTVTIVETIRQLLHQSGTRRILACAPSNSAADIIADRLRPLGVTQLFRLVAPSRDPKTHVKELVEGHFVRIDMEGNFVLPTLEELTNFRVIVCTCVSSFWVRALGVQRGHFSHIFVDEAGQAYESETTIPIKFLASNTTNIVLSGDPKQLGPIVRSDIAKTLGMTWSYLDRLMAREPYQFLDDNNRIQRNESQTPRIDCTGITIVRLDKNFRSHPSIIQFPNERFYGGRLQACARKELTHSLLRSHEIVAPNFPIVFRSLSGKDERESTSPSFFNIEEVSVIKKYIRALKGDRRLRLTDNDFGVISPYHAQCMKIGYALKNFALGIKVGSVEEFQGQERRIILISTVRSNLDFIQHDVKHALGFVANARRFNVAVTRAQALLIVVGDSKVLALDPLWRAFLTYIYDRGGWTGNRIHWDPSETTFQSNAQWESTLRAERDGLVRRAMEVINGNSEELADDDDANVDRPWREDE